MDDATRKRLLEGADTRRRGIPVPLYLFGLVWLALAFVAVLDFEIPWARPLAYFTLGMVLLYLGALVTERLRMDKTFRELLEAFESFNRSIYGEDYKVKRAAVDILIKALGNEDDDVRQRAHVQLLRITGMDFPVEAEAWTRWWSEARASFTGAAKTRSGGGGSESS